MLKLFLVVILATTSVSILGQGTASSVVISLQRTQCYGNCPAFKFDLYSDYTVSYQGVAHVERIGNWSSTITNGQFQYITGQFDKTNFFEFADQYYKDISDGPTTYVSYSKGGNTKKVMDYHGAPEKLKKLEEKVEALIAVIQWKKQDE